MNPEPERKNKPYTFELAYLCIYDQSVDEAVQRLARFIINRQVGLDEGPAAWVNILNTQLAPPDELDQLNQLGASFTPSQWRQLLEHLRDALLACPELAEKPLPAPSN